MDTSPDIKNQATHAAAVDRLCEYIASESIKQSVGDIVRAMAIGDPLNPRAATAMNRMLLAIDWLNGGTDCKLSFAQCCAEMDYRPRHSREELADLLKLPHHGRDAIISPPAWLREFVRQIPPANIAAACRAASNFLHSPHDDSSR